MSDYTLYIANKNYSSWSLRGWLLMRAFDIPFTEKMVMLDEHVKIPELKGISLERNSSLCGSSPDSNHYACIGASLLLKLADLEILP